MNRKQALAAIRALPYMTASYDTDTREYRVTFKGLSPAVAERKACYTPDPLDAVGTAKAMSQAWAAERAGAYAATLHMRDIMDANHKAAVHALTAIPGVGSGPMGLTPDSVKASPEYQRARAASEAAFAALRAANTLLVQNFAVELAADRAARRAALEVAA